jgi:hypothetical protein
MDLKLKNVSIVLPTSESWYNYKFGNTKKNFFSIKKYSYCKYIGNSLYNNYKAVEDQHLLRKLEIYGKQFNIRFDHLEKNYNNSEIIIVINGNKLNKFQNNSLYSDKKKILIVIEPKAILPSAYIKSFHKIFDSIFIRDLNFLKIDDNKYKYYNGNNVIVKENKKIIKNKKNKFLCMMFKNKYWHHKESTSFLRFKILEWFNKKYPDDFDLYGADWDKNFVYIHRFFKSNKIIRRILIKLLSISFIKIFFSKSLKVYKGVAKDKLLTLSRYKFDMCIENATFEGSPGERIFHSLLSGTVPIYVGSKIKINFIPENCYIDFWKFKNLESLYRYIKNMKDSTYKKYLKNAENFIKSKKFFKYTTDFNALNIVKEINNLCKN